MSNLPPDPWKVLGLDKSADKSEIRTAYRKLVLKCHPDKVQDPTLKAQKQDEFQKVQHAYELLNDDTERAKYEEQLKLAEMRKAALMSKNMPNISVSRTPPRSSHSHAFFAEVRTVDREPRHRHESPHSPAAPSSGKMYANHPYASSKSYDDDVRARTRTEYEEDRERRARRAASYEQPSRSDDEKREVRAEVRETRDSRKRREAKDRRDEEDRALERERREKEARKREKEESDKKRSKDKRRDVETKFSTRSKPYVEDYDRDEVYPPAPKAEKKKVSASVSSKRVDEPREKSSSRREREESPRIHAPKHDGFLEEAAAYIERHRAKAAKVTPGLTRAQTFQPQPTYAPAPSPPPVTSIYADDDVVRRSSARTSRRPSYDIGAKSQEKLYSSSQKKSREDIEPVDTSARAERVAPPRGPDRIIPVLQKTHSMPVHKTQPAVVPESPPRRPLRQNTDQAVYSRPVPAPLASLGRSQTFAEGVRHGHYPEIMRGVPEVLDSDEEDRYERRRRHRSTRRTTSPEPLPTTQTTRRYKAGKGVPVTPLAEYTEPMYDADPYPQYDDHRSSRRHASAYREEPGYYYDTADGPFTKVKTSKPLTTADVEYSKYGPPSQGSWRVPVS